MKIVLASTALLALLVIMAAPASALPGDLEAAALSVVNKTVGNVLTWQYPDGIKPKDVASIEVWRFEGTNTGTFVQEVHGNGKKAMTYIDHDSQDPNALYTMRYTTKDGEESAYSMAASAVYPHCYVLVVGLNAPYLSGPYNYCFLPPPQLYNEYYFVMSLLQNNLG